MGDQPETIEWVDREDDVRYSGLLSSAQVGREAAIVVPCIQGESCSNNQERE